MSVLVHFIAEETCELPTYWRSSNLPYTSQAESFSLKASMRQNSVQHRTGRSSGKVVSAYRSASRRPRAARRPETRRRAAIAAGRKGRRPLLFYALTASVAGELTAVAVDKEVLVLLFSLTGLFLCAVIFRAAKA